MLSPMQRYQQDIRTGHLQADVAQEQACIYLENIYQKLQQSEHLSFWQKLFAKDQIQGLYLWGDVGRGKTYLMDSFYHCLTIKHKVRLHFHRFMYQVHQKLAQLQEQQLKNPLAVIAKEFAEQAKLLCFDEFYVSDVTDAMIMAGLFQALFDHGVVLVCTSNIEPKNLYKDGVHRDRFLPVIDLIEQQCKVHYLASETDYRLRALTGAEIYHSPLDAQAEKNLEQYFTAISAENLPSKQDIITISSREVLVKSVAEGVLWCDFHELCEKPRSQIDYIEIAKLYHTVLLSGLPQLEADNDSAARRFIALVDEFYDHNVKLIISAAVPVEQLYRGEKFQFEFERTQSRLIEMQSEDYLARAHQP